jgi:hypothetical protein
MDIKIFLTQKLLLPLKVSSMIEKLVFYFVLEFYFSHIFFHGRH